MHPAKSCGILMIVKSIVTLAMVLEAPGALLNRFVVGGEHAAFAARRHDFVLTKRERRYVSEAAYRAAFIVGAVGLRAIFYHFQSACSREFQNGIHITRPACQMDGHNGLRPGGEEGPNCVCS